MSMSVSAGKHNARHNTDTAYRAELENVDPKRSRENVVLADEAIGKAYKRLFGESLSTYNAKQLEKGHPERCIDNYCAKIEDAYRRDQAKVKAGAKGRGNVPQPQYEYVFQLGNMDSAKDLDPGKAKAIYTETWKRVREQTSGAIDWYQGVIHMDEATPHMHMVGIAYGTGNKRGLGTQVSMTQALRKLGLQRLPDLQSLLMRELEQVAHEHGIERDVMRCDRPHQDVAAWKQTQRDVADMTQRLETKSEQVAAQEARSAALAAEIEQRKEELDGIKNEVSQAFRERDMVMDDLRELRNEKNRLEAILDGLQAKAQGMVAALVEVGNVLQKQGFPGSFRRALEELPNNPLAQAMYRAAHPIETAKDVRKAVKALDREMPAAVRSLKDIQREMKAASVELDDTSRTHGDRDAGSHIKRPDPR